MILEGDAVLSVGAEQCHIQKKQKCEKNCTSHRPKGYKATLPEKRYVMLSRSELEVVQRFYLLIYFTHSTSLDLTWLSRCHSCAPMCMSNEERAAHIASVE